MKNQGIEQLKSRRNQAESVLQEATATLEKFRDRTAKTRGELAGAGVRLAEAQTTRDAALLKWATGDMDRKAYDAAEQCFSEAVRFHADAGPTLDMINDQERKLEKSVAGAEEHLRGATRELYFVVGEMEVSECQKLLAGRLERVYFAKAEAGAVAWPGTGLPGQIFGPVPEQDRKGEVLAEVAKSYGL
jgi:hypothetical protein